jgi:hypothetical protein
MEHEVERKVRLFSKTQMTMEQETGITSSLNEEDMKKYLEEVLQEIQTFRQKDEP